MDRAFLGSLLILASVAVMSIKTIYAEDDSASSSANYSAKSTGILMPNVKLLGSMSAEKAGRLNTTVISERQARSQSSAETPIRTRQVTESGMTDKPAKAAPPIGQILNQRYSAHAAGSPAGVRSGIRYNGYVESQTSLSVWIDGVRIQISVNDGADSINKEQVVGYRNGRLAFSDKKNGVIAFMPGQLIPRQVLSPVKGKAIAENLKN